MRPIIPGNDSVKTAKFQFHKGTIETGAGGEMEGQELHFNSIKVRLRLVTEESAFTEKIFQFHKGTIETVILWLLSMIKLNFNSIKVRLRLLHG